MGIPTAHIEATSKDAFAIIGKVVTESIVLKKDAPFFWNGLGRLISFEYNTFFLSLKLIL